jgi:DNA-binding transcriptional LysR family regulator
VFSPSRVRLLCQLETLGTIRAVALAVHQSPSSVSQQLSRLETDYGTRLLERNGRRVRLTEAGHLLASRGRAILDEMAAVDAELRSFDGTPTGIVRVGAFPSAIHSLALPAANAVQQRHPGVEVQLQEIEPRPSVQALLRGDVDITVTTTDFLDAPLMQDVQLVPIAVDSIVVVAPRGHAIEQLDAIDLATLAGESWTFELEGAWMSTVAERLCRSAGFEPRVVCRFNNYLLALQHVESGQSLALLPELAVDQRYDLVTRPLDPPLQRRIVAAVRASSISRIAVREVLDALRESGAVRSR